MTLTTEPPMASSAQFEGAGLARRHRRRRAAAGARPVRVPCGRPRRSEGRWPGERAREQSRRQPGGGPRRIGRARHGSSGTHGGDHIRSRRGYSPSVISDVMTEATRSRSRLTPPERAPPRTRGVPPYAAVGSARFWHCVCIVQGLGAAGRDPQGVSMDYRLYKLAQYVRGWMNY